MQQGIVLGQATSTVKHATLQGWRLLLVQPMGTDEKIDGEPLLALDNLGAAVGSRVILTNDGKGTRELVGARNTPARWWILGICDE